MVKSYLRYLHETTFGTVNSPLCKSIESLSPEYILAGTDDVVTLWNCKLNAVRLKFQYKKDEYNPSSLVVGFILTSGLKSTENGRKELRDRHLFVGYKDGTVRRFTLSNSLLRDLDSTSASSGNEALEVDSDVALIGHKMAVTCLSLSLNEELLLTGSNDGNVFVWNVFDGHLAYTLKGHKNGILGVAYYFNPDFKDERGVPEDESWDQGAKKRRRERLGVSSLPKGGATSLVGRRDDLGYAISISKDNIKVWDLLNETCINTVVEPLLQFTSFTLESDKLYVSHKNNVITCYQISSPNDVKALYTIENKHTYLKCKSLQHVALTLAPSEHSAPDETTEPEMAAHLLFVTYNKSVYVYRLLNEDEVALRRDKRLKRVNEKLKLKINKIKRVLKMTNRAFDPDKHKEDMRSQYTYLKSLLTSEGAQAPEEAHTSDLKDEDEYAHSDYYKLLHIYNVTGGMNITLNTDSGATEESEGSENTINSLQVYDYYAVVNFSNNALGVYRFNRTSLGLSLSKKDWSPSDGGPVFESLYKMNMYHGTNIRLLRLSPDNRRLLTLSNNRLVVFNTANNHPINSINNSFYYKTADGEDTEAESVDLRESERVSALTGVIFINNNNILMVSRSNKVYVYNLNTHNCYLMTSMASSLDDYGEDEHNNEIIDAHYDSSDGDETLLVVFKYNWVKKISLSTGSVLNELNTNQQITHSQVDHKHLYLGLLNNNILIVFYNSFKVYLTLFGHSLPLTSLAVSSDTVFLASSSLDKTIKIWDLKYGNIVKSLLQHSKTVTQTKFLNNTHYLLSIGLDNRIKLYDCDEFVLITEISDFNYPITSVEISTYNYFFYVTGTGCYCVAKYMTSNDLIFVEEEHEKLQDRQITKELNVNAKILSTLDQLVQMLEMDAEEERDNKLRGVNNILSNLNHNLTHNLIMLLPFINIEQLLDSILAIFETYTDRGGNGSGKESVVNLESLVYVALLVAEVYLRQFVNNKTSIYKLKAFVQPILAKYMETVQFNKAALEFIKNAIVANNNANLKRLM